VPASQSAQVDAAWRLSMGSYVENGDLVVPPERYFALGDNRDLSFDSRFWGFIPRENIIGRPMFIYWSFASDPGSYERTSMADRVGNIVDVVVHFFDKTRWRRTLNPVS
jgi:signal peptidase I